MRLLRPLLVASMVAAATLACGGFPDLRDIEIPSAEVVEPWKRMKLPIGDGLVVYCTKQTISIQYEGEKVHAMAGKYKKAMKREGFKKVGEISNEGTITISYEKKKDKVTLAVTTAAGNTVVALTES